MSVSLLLILIVAAVFAVVLWKLPRSSGSTTQHLPPLPVQPAATSNASAAAQPHHSASPARPTVSAPPSDGALSAGSTGPSDSAPAADSATPSDSDPLSASAQVIAALAEPVPQVLSDFVWAVESTLPEMHRNALMTIIGGIPRPPMSLQKLLSLDFAERASAVQLSDLVMGEPLITSKVLARVNATFYGLHQPVDSIEPAVALLGMDTVRNICLQYMLAQAFKPELTSSQQSFDAIWRASSLASELALRLSKALDLPDQGALATKVVMVFVGHLATASLLPHNAIDEWLVLDRLHRAQREQEVIGLSAGEIGAMVLRKWGLPETLVSDVVDTSRVLVTPASAIEDAQRLPRLGLAYLCVELGERLALGQLSSLADFDLGGNASADNYYLRGYLTDPLLAGLPKVLHMQSLETAVQQMLGKGGKVQ